MTKRVSFAAYYIPKSNTKHKMNQEFAQLFKTAVTLGAAWMWQATCPAFPFAVVCTAMVFGDVVTARRLARRLGRRVPSQRQRLKFSSARFSKTLYKLGRIYALLLLAALVQFVVTPRVELLRYVAAAICFWQAVSMLENEASANESSWARILRKVLIDKTERHLGISLDELKDSE